MRICIVSRGDISIFPPTQGASVKLYSTIKFLSLLGHDVYFVTSENDAYIHVKNGDFKEKKYPKWLTKFLPYGKIRRNFLLALGIPREDVVLYKPLLDIGLWLKTLYVVKRENVDIVQSEFPAFAIPAIITKLVTGTPTVLVEHNVEYFRILETSRPFITGRWILKLVEKTACKFSDAVVAITEKDKIRLDVLGTNPEKIFIIPHGVDLGEYKDLNGERIRKDYGLDGITLIFHGVLIYPPNLNAVKTIAEQILPKLEEAELNVKALVVGDYPPENIKHPNLIFTGVVKNLPDYIDAGNIAIVPITSGGGMRMKILEYFAAKKPVISTFKGAEGIKLNNGKEIILTTIEKFPNEIVKLVKSKKLRNKLIDNASKFVEGYDWEIICNKYVELYHHLLS